MNEQEAKNELSQAKEELLEAKAKLNELSAKLKELWDVMEKIGAAQNRLKKVEEKLFLEGFSKNRLSTASIKIRKAQKPRNPGPGIHDR